jgi:regulator of protease activity HflC (stomatin/prohibitin superfamily)
MKSSSAFPGLVFLVILAMGAAVALPLHQHGSSFAAAAAMIVTILCAFIVSSAIRVADPWTKAVVLRLGKFRSLEGPGLFFIIPLIETIPYWLDTRVLTSSFKAEKTLTKDTVPVDVDAVLFWKIIDPQKAALAVADYQAAISWASQTALRDVIGKTMLSDMLEGRDKISNALQVIIDQRTEPWGINVISVEVKGCADSVLAGGCNVHAGAGGARASGARDPWRVRVAGRSQVRRGRQDLCEQSGRAASAGDEHAL